MLKSKSDLSPKTLKMRAVLICAAVTLILIIILASNYQKYSRVQKRFKQKNSQLLALEIDIKGLKESVQRFKQERQRLEVLLFSDKDIATFLTHIAEFARKAQIRIVDMQTQKIQEVKPPEAVKPAISQAPQDKKEEVGPQFAALPITMNIEAPFERIVNFLISLEKTRQLLTLSNVSLKRGIYPLLTCKVTLRLYSLKKLEEIYNK